MKHVIASRHFYANPTHRLGGARFRPARVGSRRAAQVARKCHSADSAFRPRSARVGRLRFGGPGHQSTAHGQTTAAPIFRCAGHGRSAPGGAGTARHGSGRAALHPAAARLHPRGRANPGKNQLCIAGVPGCGAGWQSRAARRVIYPVPQCAGLVRPRCQSSPGRFMAG